MIKRVNFRTRPERYHLHRLLEQACEETEEGGFVPARFVEVCMRELWEKIPFDNPEAGAKLVKTK